MTGTAPSTDPEAAAFLAAHADMRMVELLVPDLNGILRGKRLAPREVDGLFRRGVSLPATAVLLDSRGSLIGGLPYGTTDGDPDCLCRPVAGTLAPVPWADGLGQCLGGLVAADGAPWFADSRHVLGRVLDRFRADGLTPVVAVEFEFYLLDDPEARPPLVHRERVPGSARRAAGPRAYSVDDLRQLEPFFTDVLAACQAQRVPAEAIVSEYGGGQYEVNLRHVADACQACDHAILLRRIVRGVAARHRMAATFMARPFTGLDGSGMHVHVSLLDKAGRNVFMDSARLGQAAAGMLAALPESQAIFAPNANSWRRLQPGCFAPVAADWGHNHRQVAVRVPLSDRENTRLEHRVAGADCNPYLAMAAILAGLHRGLARALDPPPPTAAGPEGVEEAMAAREPLVTRWEPALDRFAAGTLLPDYLGEEFCRVFAAARRFEADAYHAQVAETDYDWYLPAI